MSVRVIYQRCSLCREKSQGRGPVRGDGPQPCPLLLLGEGPGPHEDDNKIPFCGPTGREVNERYLLMTDTWREEVRVSNVSLCSFPGYRNPTQVEAATCAAFHLPGEIAKTKPRLIVAMGAIACSVFDEKIDLATQHGFPSDNSYSVDGEVIWEGTVFPTFHPAAGFRARGEAISMQVHLEFDFLNLGDYLKDRLVLPQDQYPDPDYQLLRGGQEVWEDLAKSTCVKPKIIAGDCPRVAIDTESDPVPRMLSYSYRPGTGRVILAGDTEAKRALKQWVLTWQPEVYMHYAKHDQRVLSRMEPDMEIPWPLIRDTMMDAYHLSLPQALKTLCYRIEGMEMEDFMDVAKPCSSLAAAGYLDRVAAILPLELPQPWLEGRSRRIMSKARQASKEFFLKDADVFQRWESWMEKEPRLEQLIEDLLGESFPVISIAHVPMERAVPYAARDADGTLRLSYSMDKIRERFNREHLLEGAA